MINERRNEIKAYIAEHQSIRIDDLIHLYPDVSVMTLRRDLTALEAEGIITRFRGGARINNTQLQGPTEDMYSRREIANIEAKNAICSKALAFVEEKHSIFFDSGTTIMSLAQQLPDQNLILFTSAPNIALEIVARSTLPRVTLLGGNLSRNTFSCSGNLPMNYLRSINIDIAFMATSAFSLENGFTAGNPYESEIKTEVIRKARRVIMLMDTEKIDRNMPYTFAHLKDINVLISESTLPADVLQAARANDVTVL